MKRRSTAILLTAIMTAGLITGCSSSNDAPETTAKEETQTTGQTSGQETAPIASDLAGHEIEVALNYSDNDLASLQTLIDQFTEETGVKVNIVSYGSDYESVMKTRMASNSLPDVWNTHGWATLRYGEYLMDLSDQPWASNVSDSVINVISADGKLNCLCITSQCSGIVYNKTVLDKAGVDPTTIRTWDDFTAALRTVTDAGYTAISVAAAQPHWICYTAAPYWTTPGGEHYSEDLIKSMGDGSFDWDGMLPEVLELFQGWYNNGYMNENISTATWDEIYQAMAADKTAFSYGSTNVIKSIWTYNENTELGIMPSPASAKDGKMTYYSGEGFAFGIWRETKEADASKAFLDFFARPDISAKVCEIIGGIPSLTDSDASITGEIAALNDSDAIFGDAIYYDNVFDRQYLPSGMWSEIGTGGSLFAADINRKGIADCTAYIRDAYLNKISSN